MLTAEAQRCAEMRRESQKKQKQKMTTWHRKRPSDILLFGLIFLRSSASFCASAVRDNP